MASETAVARLGVLAESVGSTENTEESILGALDVLEKGGGPVGLVNDPGDGGGLEVGVDLACDADEVVVGLESVDKGAEIVRRERHVEAGGCRELDGGKRARWWRVRACAGALGT